MKPLYILISIFFLFSCTKEKLTANPESQVFLVVLGIAQDAGYPQAGCNKSCCKPVWEGKVKPKKVISLGLVDKPNNKVYLLDATPDFKEQLQILLSYLPNGKIDNLAGIFLTHAHIGHYTGLMDLGKEAMGSHDVPVYVMPKMKSFLENNGPWSQLVSLNNIKIILQKTDSAIWLSEQLSITPFLVPHRDEYSETVGYSISTTDKKALFIPDIDKWSKWDHDIVAEVEQVDYAFLDATFYSEKELPNRDMREIPHPFVPETIETFKNSPRTIKNKVVFIHFNHTNPLIQDGKEYEYVLDKGYKVSREKMLFNLN